MPDGKPYMTELAMVPFDIEQKTIAPEKALHFYVATPSVAELDQLGKISRFVKDDDNLRTVCEKAHSEGLTIDASRQRIEDYLKSFQVPYEKGKTRRKAMILSKSIAGLDRPLLCQYYGAQWVEDHLNHRMTDLSSCIGMLVDSGLGILSSTNTSKVIAETIGGESIPHTALEDATILGKVYLSLLSKLSALQ